MLFTDDRRRAAARALIEREDAIHAPSLILTETANALWKITRAAAGSGSRSDAVHYVCGELPERLHLWQADGDLLRDAMAIAFELDHPVYDCLYVALAARRNEPLFTFDERLVRTVASTRFSPLLRIP